MISFSKKTVKKSVIVSLVLFAIYSLAFFIFAGIEYYQTYNQKIELIKELEEKKVETNLIKDNIEKISMKSKIVKSKYLDSKQLENKLKTVFKNYSLADYSLSLVDTKMMCIDRTMLIVNLEASSKEGLQAGVKILEYLGDVTRKDGFDTLYFVDYLQKARN